MRKIPTIFIRDMSKQPALVTPEWTPGCEWVRDGEGRATVKLDGTCCMVRNGKLYKRRELKLGQIAPADFEQADFDEMTGKTVGWVPVTTEKEDQYHREAFEAYDTEITDGTYELMGPKIQGNKSKLERHMLIPHGTLELPNIFRTYGTLRSYFDEHVIEGIVWHHEDGIRKAKLKKRDFGLKW